MAGSVNKVIIVGNLGHDPEVRTTDRGSKVVNLSVATTETWKNKAGERQEQTEWHKVVIFNETLAGIAERFLRKGSKCYIEGSLQTRKWQDKTGGDRYSTEIVVGVRGALTFLDPAPDSLQSSAKPQERQRAYGRGSAAQFSDEAPF